MKSAFALVLLALATSACGNNSVSTKNDVEEAVRAATQSTLPVVTELELNAEYDVALAANARERQRKEKATKIEGGVQQSASTCNSEYSMTEYTHIYVDTLTKKTYKTREECEKADDTLINNFVQKYAAGFRMNVKAGKLWKTTTDVYNLDPTTVAALQNDMALPIPTP